jgi:hypothetical protein
MSRHYNTQHPERSRSHYPARLAARGFTKTPTMPTLEYLRNKQTSDYWLEAHPAIVANLEEFRASK